MSVEVSIVIPTVDGRERWLELCVQSYERTLADVPHNITIIRNRKTCGEAWNEGVADMMGAKFVHLTADDIVAHDGWWEAGLARIWNGGIPAARILHGDGTLQSCGDAEDRPEGWASKDGYGDGRFPSRIPLLPAALAERIFPIPPIHYYTDNIVSDRARTLGWDSIVTRDYLFTHYLAGEGRIDCLAEDGLVYVAHGGWHP